MKKFLLAVLVMAILAIISGCNGIEYPNACDDIQGESVLCDLAKKYDVNLTAIADGLGLADAVAIKNGLVSKEKVLETAKRLRLLVESPITYAAFKLDLESALDELPGAGDVVDTYVNALTMDQVIYSADKALIIGRLDKIIAKYGG